MKQTQKVIYSLVAVSAIGLLVYATRRSNTKRRMADVADRGYETAADLHYPKTGYRFTKLHYGPVLPHHDFE
ncbi:MAG: hypothetical protein WKF88_06010 [Ferruginibacter sp.]